MIRLRRRKLFSLSPDLTPFIDVVFNLLIFFLLTAVYLPYGLNLDLPQAASVTPQNSKNHFISINRQEELYFDEQPSTFGDIRRRLLEVDPKSSITIQADQRISYGLFVRLLDIIRKSGTHPLVLAADVSTDSRAE